MVLYKHSYITEQPVFEISLRQVINTVLTVMIIVKQLCYCSIEIIFHYF